MKRPLDINGGLMEEYWHKTEDNIHLRLTRFYNPKWEYVKGPILFIPGLTANRGLFMSDLIKQNIIETLCLHQFDTWIMDWRTSIDMISHFNYNLDDASKYDFNSAILKILQITHCKDVIIMSHCVGSIVFVQALLAGCHLFFFCLYTLFFFCVC